MHRGTTPIGEAEYKALCDQADRNLFPNRPATPTFDPHYAAVGKLLYPETCTHLYAPAECPYCNRRKRSA